MIVISDNVLLIFEQKEGWDKMKLVTWGMISSIENIKRNME